MKKKRKRKTDRNVKQEKLNNLSLPHSNVQITDKVDIITDDCFLIDWIQNVQNTVYFSILTLIFHFHMIFLIIFIVFSYFSPTHNAHTCKEIGFSLLSNVCCFYGCKENENVSEEENPKEISTFRCDRRLLFWCNFLCFSRFFTANVRNDVSPFSPRTERRAREQRERHSCECNESEYPSCWWLRTFIVKSLLCYITSIIYRERVSIFCSACVLTFCIGK